MTGLGQARKIFSWAVGRTSPVERSILGIALAEKPRDLRLHQFGTEIKGVRAVIFDSELREQRHGIPRHVMTVAIIEVNAVLGGFDTKVGILHLSSEFGNLMRRVGKGLTVVECQQGTVVILRQTCVLACGEHYAPGCIMFLDCAPRMRTDLNDK